MIEVKNIHKSFDGIEVLRGISTTFDKGKTNLIIGQSGSGKTVFIKCLLGLFDYEEGYISYDGKIFSQLSEDEKRNLRADIGMVFQGGALFDSMTIAENVMFPLKMFTNKTLEEIKEQVKQSMKDYKFARFKSNQFEIEAKYSNESYHDETSINEAGQEYAVKLKDAALTGKQIDRLDKETFKENKINIGINEFCKNAEGNMNSYFSQSEFSSLYYELRQYGEQYSL